MSGYVGLGNVMED